MPYRAQSSRGTAAQRLLVVDGLVVHVTRKPIRNMYLRIKPPQGDLAVSAPTGMTDDRIVAFVRGRKPWIAAQRRRLAESRRWMDDGRTGRPGMDAMPGSGDWWTPERKAEARSAIDAQLPALLDHWSAVIGRRPTHITLRAMTTRWGSCTPKTGRIRLNLQLGLLPPCFLEYVLVHEMTHLWVGGHGAEFQRRMTRYLPDWRRLRRDLNRYATA